MPAEDDILAHMDPAVRQRVEAELSRFEPFLGLLSAWKSAVDGHIESVEQRVADRIVQQFFPEGDWRFPAQTLAVPQEPAARAITPETAFSDPLTRAAWSPCGTGWTLPSQVEAWRLEPAPGNRYALVFDISHEAQKPGTPLLTPGRGQLAFVAGPEPLAAALADAEWRVRQCDGPPEPVTAERYPGYLEFEREMFVSGSAQRHLERWLPPCHPYGRKCLNLVLAADAGTRASDDDFPPPSAADSGAPVTLTALIDESTAGLINTSGNTPPLILNAVPVAQMTVASQPIVAPMHTVGEAYKVTFSGLSGFFAGAARADNTVRRAGFTRRSTSDPRALRERGRALHDVDVTCDQEATEVRAYYGCLGEQSNPGRTAPDRLSLAGGRDFATPFPAVGALDVPLRAYDDPGSRREWYDSLLRPELLTEGDITEILRHYPAVQDTFDVGQTSIQLDVVNDVRRQRTHWDSYLWPSVVGSASLLETRMTHLTASRIPIIPVLRLHLHPRRSDFPAFLLDDIARFAASVISRRFMIGWYRVEGQVSELW